MILRPNALSPSIYREIRQKAGFQDYADADIAFALAQSFYTVVAEIEGRPVGIARVIADGRIAFFVKDVVVDPAFQKRGIGRAIMENVLLETQNHACKHATVSLLALAGTEPFYETLGFHKRPQDKMGAGMTLTI